MSSNKTSHRGRRFLLWTLGTIVVTSFLLVFAVSRIFRVDRNAARLRDDFVQSVNASVSCQVQFNLGPAVLAPARLILGLVEEVPPEARLAISAARRASVGVYTIDCAGGSVDPDALFDSATRKMDARAWSRIVAVRDGDESVMIYLPREWSADDEVNLCIAVCDGQELVLVSARIRTEPLLALASMHLPANFLGPI
ncbi:MAG: hypothetical protein R3F07_13285 [Opitutaceae bacterium]